jgi:hypothetical protein
MITIPNFAEYSMVSRSTVNADALSEYILYGSI